MIEVSLHFEYSIANNQDEYEAFIVVLSLAAKMGVKALSCEHIPKLWYHKSKEMNNMSNVIFNLIRTRAFGVNHSFIQETKRSQSLEP